MRTFPGSSAPVHQMFDCVDIPWHLLCMEFAPNTRPTEGAINPGYWATRLSLNIPRLQKADLILKCHSCIFLYLGFSVSCISCLNLVFSVFLYFLDFLSLWFFFSLVFHFNGPQGRLSSILESTARYVGLLLAHAEGFGLQPRLLFCPSGKKRAFYAVLAYFCHFWCSVITSLPLSSNL